jgi:hypothetical protein
LLAYLWLRDKGSIDEEQSVLLQTQLEEAKSAGSDWVRFFESFTACRELLYSAFKNYVDIKDPARAFPILLLMLDPLGEPANEHRRVLWELLFGSSEFLDHQIRHEHSLSDYLDGESQ